jgi:hypothetical protein
MTYELPSDSPVSVLQEDGIEYGFIGKSHGPDLLPLWSSSRNPKNNYASPRA